MLVLAAGRSSVSEAVRSWPACVSARVKNSGPSAISTPLAGSDSPKLAVSSVPESVFRKKPFVRLKPRPRSTVKPASSVTLAPRSSSPRASRPKSTRSGPRGVLVTPEKIKSTMNSSDTPRMLLKFVFQLGESELIAMPPIVNEKAEENPAPRAAIFSVSSSERAFGVVTKGFKSVKKPSRCARVPSLERSMSPISGSSCTRSVWSAT